jgi:hypothetical protein
MYTDRDRTSEKSFITLLIIILIVIGLAVYAFMDRDRIARWFAKDVIEKEVEMEKEPLEEKIATLEEEIAIIQEETRAQAPSVPEERMEEVFGEDKPAPPAEVEKEETEEDACRDLQQQLVNFFDYLDRQDYVAAYGLEGGTYAHFKGLLPRMFKNPPVVVRETDSLLKVLQNSAHFFRVLGKNNTYLLRDILKNDGDIMEPSFELLHQVIGQGDICRSKGLELGMSLPLKDVYEYAVFFLNTLGGRSYLMRRDSRVRMLTQYYSILILDMANQHSLNKWGIDIRYPIDSLIVDLKGSANLTHKTDYLRTLRALKNKYQKIYGDEQPS